MPHMTLLAGAIIGLATGFLGGLLGKGGSAIATPLLHAVGVRAIIAIAAPLPATVPSTLAASSAYWRVGLIDWRVVRWTICFGIPATVVGAIATRWIGGGRLVAITDIVLIALGLRLLVSVRRSARPKIESIDIGPSRFLLAGVPSSSASSRDCLRTAEGSCSHRCSSLC